MHDSDSSSTATPASPPRDRRAAAATPGKETMREARARPPARARRSARYAADYPGRPARPAAEHVPGVRLAARRPAHAPHRDGAVGLGLLRLRPDLHLAFLRRAPHRRLRAVQFRNAGHRQAVRGHPRGGVQARRSRHSTTRSSSSICACRPPPACRCSCCRRRSTACASSASTCPASACRPMPRPRTCWPARCSRYARNEAEQGPVQAPRGGAQRQARP